MKMEEKAPWPMAAWKAGTECFPVLVIVIIANDVQFQ